VTTSPRVSSTSGTSVFDAAGDGDDDAAAASRIEAGPLEHRLDTWSHARHQRQEHAGEKVERRRGRIVRAAFDDDAARARGRDQRRQDRLQHERRAAGRPYRELVVARRHGAWRERQRLRVQLVTLDARGANGGGRLYGGQVLTQQSRLAPRGADALDAERRSGDQRQPERGTQNLPATLSDRSVQRDHDKPLNARPTHGTPARFDRLAADATTGYRVVSPTPASRARRSLEQAPCHLDNHPLFLCWPR
jgi:hypothetical protein